MTFITLANPAGQPIDFIIKPAKGTEVLKNVTGKTICKWFWLLKSITIDIAYTINNQSSSFTRKINAEKFTPKSRLCESPKFKLNASGNNWSAFYNLDLEHVYQSKNKKNLFDIHFTILESANNGNVCFSLDSTTPSNEETFKLGDKFAFNFETSTLTLHAWIKEKETSNMEPKVAINKMQITTEYFGGM